MADIIFPVEFIDYREVRFFYIYFSFARSRCVCGWLGALAGNKYILGVTVNGVIRTNESLGSSLLRAKKIKQNFTLAISIPLLRHRRFVVVVVIVDIQITTTR